MLLLKRLVQTLGAATSVLRVVEIVGNNCRKPDRPSDSSDPCWMFQRKPACASTIFRCCTSGERCRGCSLSPDALNDAPKSPMRSHLLCFFFSRLRTFATGQILQALFQSLHAAAEKLTDDNYIHRVKRGSSKLAGMLKRSLDCLHSQSGTAESAKTGKPLRANSKQPRNAVQADCPDATVRELLRQIAMMLHPMRNRSDAVRRHEIQDGSECLRDLNCHCVDRVRCLLQRGFLLKSLPRIRECLRLFRLLVLHVLHLLHVLADAEDISLLA